LGWNIPPYDRFPLEIGHIIPIDIFIKNVSARFPTGSYKVLGTIRGHIDIVVFLYLNKVPVQVIDPPAIEHIETVLHNMGLDEAEMDTRRKDQQVEGHIVAQFIIVRD